MPSIKAEHITLQKEQEKVGGNLLYGSLMSTIFSITYQYHNQSPRNKSTSKNMGSTQSMLLQENAFKDMTHVR